MYRLTRSCGSEPNDEEKLANVDKDEVDAGWYFLLPQAETRAQLKVLNERSDRGQQYPEDNFCRDRPDPDQEAETTLESNSTRREVENVDMHGEDDYKGSEGSGG